MTKTTNPSIRALSILLMLLWSLGIKAQTNSATLNWDYSVGCIEYDHDLKERKRFLESIEDTPCIRVCENTQVNYFIQGANIANVSWEITGGNLAGVTGAQNQNAAVHWAAAGNGTIKITITYTNNTTKVFIPCVEIINSPRAQFKIYGMNDEATFCVNTPINFNNISLTNGGTDIIYYNWDFDDGNYSNVFEPTHSFSQPGTYTVTLVATNKCYCISKFSIQVTIIPRPNVVISCPAVVCESPEKVTYTANSECGGEWRVEGGTIVNETPFSIEVVWNNVNPDEGFGYVNFRERCSCPLWITVKVPVVLRRGVIQGADEICFGKQERYSMPQWPTTDFIWELVTDTNPSQVVMVDQRNEIIIEGLQPGTYRLVCTYTNTLLGCGGYAEKTIKIVSPVEISGPVAFCSGTLKTYTSSSGSADWELKKGTTVVATNTGATFQYNFPTGGAYVLTASITGHCASAPLAINVTQTPDTPTGTITGENIICPGMPYSYTYTNTVPNTLLVWQVTGGTIQGDNTGEEISVVFGATGPYEVKVQRRSLNAQACESGFLTKNVNKIVITPVITNNDGLSLFCPSSITSFTVNLGGIDPDVLTWEVVSDTTPENSNFGNIISGVNSTTITVGFNEISTTPNGILRLTVIKCGITEIVDYPVTIMTLPNISIGTISNVCPLNNTITVPVSTPGITSGTLTFDFGNGNTYGPVNVNGLGSYTINNLFSNTTTGNISQILTVTLNSPNGCNYVPTASKNVTVYPETNINISPGYSVTICPEESYSHTLTASFSTGITNTAGIKWYKNNVEIDSGTTTYTINNTTQPSPQGVYRVEVTDDNGCTVSSQSINISESCDTTDPCEVGFIQQPVLTWEWNCDEITANVDADPMPDSIFWTGGSLLTLDNGQETPDVVFTTDVPGTHLIIVDLTYGDCVIRKSVMAVKNYEPKLTFTMQCNETAGSYNVTLHNNSTVAAINPADITYTFTGPGIPTGSGSGATQSYTLTGLAPGTYNYTLTLSAPGKPDCSVTETLVLQPMPSADFTLSGNEFCAEEVITGTITSYDPQNTYLWKFDGTSFYASGQATELNITNPGVKDITLLVTTPQGCSVESPLQTIEIKQASFEGEFNPSEINICEGTTAPAISYQNYNNFDPDPSGYIWMKGNQQVGTGTTFTPTESGIYWAVLIDADDCKFNGMAASPVSMVVRKRPFVSIEAASNQLCYGESTTLNGIIANNALERRWLLNGTAMAVPYGVWSATTPLEVAVNNPATGTYTYTLEVRPQGDTECGNSFDHTVTVHAAVSAPTLSYTILTCEPYTVRITASGSSTGNYNWSNGASGQTIEVTNGGVYEVTYTAPTGCSASASVTVPHSVDRYLWVFPTGCFDVCPFNDPAPYILGPLGIFSSHKWLVNGNNVQSGGLGPVGNLSVTQAGTYQLELNNEGCVYQSGPAYISPNPEKCYIPDCELRYSMKDPVYQNGEYWFDGFISNPNTYPLTITFSSFNGLGTYAPASITILPGGSYNLLPLIFTPNPGVTIGTDYLVLQVVEQECMKLIPFKLNPRAGKPSAATDSKQQQNGMQVSAEATLVAAPNPASTIAAVSYDLGTQFQTAQSLTVHTLNGSLLEKIPLTQPKATMALDVSRWSAGTYIISLYADGAAVMQQKLVKK